MTLASMAKGSRLPDLPAARSRRDAVGISGSMLVQVRLADEAVSKDQAPAACVRFLTLSSRHIKGAADLTSCSPVLARELQQGMTHFFFEQNPLLGGKIWESWDHHYALYSFTEHGRPHILPPTQNAQRSRAFQSSPSFIKHVAVSTERCSKIGIEMFEDSVLDLCFDVFAR